MARTVKPRDSVDLDAFFAGLPEVRAYLDRHLQDPARRRARLSKIASELLKPREARARCDWLATEVAAAVGAGSASIWVTGADESWIRWCVVGTLTREAEARALMEALPAASAEPVQSEAGLLMPLTGVERIAGVLWLELPHALDAASVLLLQAIADIAGVALDQALALENQ